MKTTSKYYFSVSLLVSGFTTALFVDYSSVCPSGCAFRDHLLYTLVLTNHYYFCLPVGSQQYSHSPLTCGIYRAFSPKQVLDLIHQVAKMWFNDY